MPRYRFTGDYETVLMGLSHGVNAELHREEHGQPDGSTVVALPGDEVTTSEPYPHMLMLDVETDEPSAFPSAFPFVGERGPEVRSFPDGVVVHTADETAAAAKARRERKPRTPRTPRTPKPNPPEPNAPATDDTTNPEGEE